uniref:WD repeat domain 86 n=1 Tax=Propithecus coquereli TaxID=379532 RepID=A0A2K6GJF4_PROCO
MGGGGSALRVCADHRGGINWLSLSPDGQRLLTGSEDGTARLWSTADGRCCALLQGHESYVTFCQLEDEAAFTCSADCTIRRWDVLTGQCLQVYRGHTSIVNRILVVNNQLFSSSYDRTARVWSVDKGQMSQEFRGHRNCVLTLAYSAPWDLPGALCSEEAVAGGLLVTGSTDGTAKVWQVASGCCHQTLRGHTGAVLCLVLDTPGHTAFTGSTDATIRAWDILSGEQLRVFREHQGSVICLEVRLGAGALALSAVPGSGQPSLPLLPAREPARLLGQCGQDRQVLAGRHGGARVHVRGPQTQRERPQVPRGHLVHGQRGRLRPRLRRAVGTAAEGVPGPCLRHQLPAGARPGALHRLARRRAAPVGRARALGPAPRAAQAQPPAPLQQQGGLRRRAPAAGLTAARPATLSAPGGLGLLSPLAFGDFPKPSPECSPPLPPSPPLSSL